MYQLLLLLIAYCIIFNYQAVNYVHAFVLSEHEVKLGRNKYMKTENYNEI